MTQERVLISTWGSKGGVDAVVRDLHEGLRKRNIDVDVITHNPKDSSVTCLSSEGDRFYDTFEKFIASKDWLSFKVINLHACNYTPDEIRRLREVAEHAPIIYHTHGLIAHVGKTELSESKEEYAKKWVALVSGLSELEQREVWKRNFDNWGPATRQQENIFRDADKLVFLTDFTRDKFREWYPEHSQGNQREVILPNGSDFHKYADDPRILERARAIREQIGSDSQVIAYSGRITVPKGTADLAKAFDKAKDFYPKAKLLLIGDPRDGKEIIFSNIRPEHKKDVIFTDWVKDKAELAAYLAASDVLAIPSYHETFSVSALEGMFMGTPVIMGDVDGSHEVYVTPQLAYGTPPGDTNRMLNLFNYLFQDPERARQNAAHVKQVVNEKYRDDTVLNKTLGLYTRAIFERYASLMDRHLGNGNREAAERLYQLMNNNGPLNPNRIMPGER